MTTARPLGSQFGIRIVLHQTVGVFVIDRWNADPTSMRPMGTVMGHLDRVSHPGETAGLLGS
jgi:hypothetical protein